MIEPYVKPCSEPLAFLPAGLVAQSGTTSEGSGQDLTVIGVNPDELFF